MNRFRAEKGQGFTHTSIGNPKMSLFVPDDNADEFMAAYKSAKAVNVPLHLTELPTVPSAFRVDLDFKFSLPESSRPRERQYSLEDVHRITKAYFEVLADYLDAPDDAFVTYVMEKETPVEYRGQLKDGLHLVWPHLVCAPPIMHLVRKLIIERASDVFAGIPITNTYEAIVDAAIIDRNNWQMYGSCKPDNQTYRVTRILRYQRASRELVDESDTKTPEHELAFVDLFSMRNKRDATPVHAGKTEEVEQYARFVVPTLDERRKNKLHQQIFSKTLNHVRNAANEDDLNLARQLVNDCLNRRRAESYEDWIKLGWALRNIDFRLLDTWVSFSKFSSKFVSGECEKLWNTMRPDTMSMGSLRWWCKQDSQEDYARILENNITALVDRCVTEQAHYDVAKVVHAMLKDDYRFTGMDTWYVFDRRRHRWTRTREGLKLRLELSTRVCCQFLHRSTQLSNQANMVAEDQREARLKHSAQLSNIATCLKKNGYKESIVRECKCLFSDDNFEALLDSHEHLLGFENGVYDLRMHEFRDGSPDDYISFSTGRHYRPHEPDSAEAAEITAYFAQVFTNVNVRRYFMDLLLMLIDGGIHQEKFYVFTGSGSNSKSALLSLVQKALGDYYCILPIALLTQQRAASNAAQSELARTRGRRVAVLQEPGENEKINIGLMKELSGGDLIMARGLYKEPVEFKPQFKMIMTCNELPEVPGDDGGTWRRIRVLQFQSKFCENPNPANPLEFPIDPSLFEKFGRWADAFIAMLIDHHKKTDAATISEPMEVRIATESYKANNDVIGQYMLERIEQTPDQRQVIAVQALFNDFKAWAYNAIAKGKRTPDRMQLKAYFEKKLGAYSRIGWRGLRFKASEVAVDSDDDIVLSD
jgi:P4 family phage/plasmid primase-like protien